MRAHIQPDLFRFLEELKQNNDREWFQENKDRYEQDLLSPLLQLISDFRFPLREISAHFVADPRRIGGSLFRIYRDTRFSKDKSPYKTAAGIQFRHKSAKDVHAPGFYLHLEPGNCFAGIGIWRPDTKTSNRVRTSIVEEGERWMEILEEDPFRRTFEQGGDSLKRPPKGFPADHPLVEQLKRKDFVAFHSLTEEETCSRDFINRYAGLCRMGSRFAKFLTEASGLPW